jgi:IS5 family transposase
LTEENEVVYRDRGYFGAKAKGYNATMKRAVKGHTLGIKDILRNKRISSKRVPGERVYSVTKEIFKARRVFVTTVKRVNLKMLCTALCYNLHQLRTLKIKKVY